MNEIITNIVLAIIGVVVPIAVKYLVNWLETKIGAETLQALQQQLELKKCLAYEAVKFVEQVYKDLHGQEKYDKAVEWLTDQLNRIGLPYTEEELKGLIEASLREIKDVFGEEWANQVTEPSAQE